MLVHPDGGAEKLQATPRVPAQRPGPEAEPPDPALRPRHAAPDAATTAYPGLPSAGQPAPTANRDPWHHPSAEQSTAPLPPVQLPQTPVIPPPRPAVNDETMVLPAFLTGKQEPAPPPAPARGGRPDPAEKLPATERGMLIFVAALLGIGTIAVVAVMGMGLTTPTKPKPTVPKPSPTASSTPSPEAAAVVPSLLPSPLADASAKPASSVKPSTHSSAGPQVLGSITLSVLGDYCTTWQPGAIVLGPGQPGPPSSTWKCFNPHAHSPAEATYPAAPNNVCRWHFQDNSAYSPARDSDPLPWKCYS